MDFEKDIILWNILNFASIAHKGQKRIGVGNAEGPPYISHPFSVFLKVREMGGNFEAQAAALLHDVIEDTKFSENDIQEFLVGLKDLPDNSIDKIIQIVLALTDNNELSRKARKEEQHKRLKRASKEARLIKFCDRLHNLLTVHKFHNPERYIKESRRLFAALEHQMRFEGNWRIVLELERRIAELENKYKLKEL